MLNVYKASAGSGKTYRLAYEYIKMLLGRRNESGDFYHFYKNYNSAHSRILAVTFTNKATKEMKQRIVKQLEVLAHNTSQSDYCKDLCKAFDCGEAQLQKNSELVLQQLLNDFSTFNISTIDSFFQQVLRSFAREVGLQGGYDVEMDSEYVATMAIEQMFSELDENGEMLEWLKQYAEESIRNNGSWNIFDKSDISVLSKELVKEEYKKYRDELIKIDLQAYKNYIDTLNNYRQAMRDSMVAGAQNLLQAIADEGITTDVFARGWIKCVDIIALKDDSVAEDDLSKAIGKFIERSANPDTWFAATKLKKHPKGVEELTRNLLPVFEELAHLLQETYIHYNSVSICLKHVYALGVLSTIDRYVAQYEREHNTILISKTPDILSGLINESDAPFIYEKVGTRIEHYMIDEFQDTSDLQWHNFEPLVRESLARNNENLIVGDVKQSIYRWRNSDWRLLHEELDRNFTYEDIHAGRDTNWRSCANVVQFNNAFFRRAASLLQSELKTQGISPDRLIIEQVFAKVEQNVSPKHRRNGGHVAINILSAPNQAGYEEQILQRLPQKIKELLDKGYRQKDIAILVNTHKEGNRIVELLLSIAAESSDVLHDLRIVSDESLLIKNAPPIKLIEGILRYMLNPSYPINELILSYEYGLINATAESGSLPSHVLARYFDATARQETIDDELRSFIAEIATKSLFEMCESIIHKFNMHENTAHVGYIEAFQDMVVEYSQTHPADLFSFIRWWDEKKKSAAVKLPENLDAITVVTIHKSKGLEFPVVILPYVTWPFTQRKGITQLKWYAPTQEPFNQIPVLPVNFSNKLASSIFASQYYEELISKYIDALNLAYVAFTRAEQELIVYSMQTKNDSIGSLLCRVLNMPPTIEEDAETIDFATYCRSEVREDEAGNMLTEQLFEIGADWQPIIEADDMAQMIDTTYCVVIPSEQRLKQRISSHNKGGNRRRNYGVLMHEILAEIVCADDVHNVVQRYVREGKLKTSDLGMMEEKIVELISLPQSARWFSTDVTVITETDILKSGEKINRPDRVVIDNDCVMVIDYKFGEIEREDYLEKVSKYMQLVADMGYKDVKGCIWYVEKNKFVYIE